MDVARIQKLLLLSVFVFFSLFACYTFYQRSEGHKPTAQSQSIQIKKRIALTFDDGPYGTSTAQVLAILESKQIPATFFLIGQNVLKQPALVKQIVAQGNQIGNHSFDHALFLATMSRSSLDAELFKTQRVIASTTGLLPHFYRPPYGKVSEAMLKEVEREGFVVVTWNDESRDWDKAVSSTTIAANVIKAARPDGVILLHDGRDTQINYPRENMLGALPTIIDSLKTEGYEFVTLDMLLGTSTYRPANTTL